MFLSASIRVMNKKKRWKKFLGVRKIKKKPWQDAAILKLCVEPYFNASIVFKTCSKGSNIWFLPILSNFSLTLTLLLIKICEIIVQKKKTNNLTLNRNIAEGKWISFCSLLISKIIERIRRKYNNNKKVDCWENKKSIYYHNNDVLKIFTEEF